MHITKVVLEGFKSFKEQTTFEFQPGLNVLVGHDEAGKSGLLHAIQFVLAGHQFQKASHMDLVKLLHSSAAGVHVKSASVEIIVDNKDRSLREEGDEIKLKRIITSTKDAYKVNGQSTPMEKVLKTLQSKLSKVNPYYITSPKKIREMCTLSTKKGFAMLGDIAGSLEDFKSVEESLREKDSLVFTNHGKKKLEKELKADRIRRKELLDEICTIEDGLKNFESDFETTTTDFCRISSKDVLLGIDSVWTTVYEMKQEEEFKSLALEYRGLVIDQFECPTEYMAAADAIAKNRLFHHVVDSDRTAMEIQKRMTKNKLPGVATFITNKKQPFASILHFNHPYHITDTAKMIVSITLKTLPGMGFIANRLFNDRFVLCPTSQDARVVSRLTGLTCVTLKGFVVHSPNEVPSGISLPHLTRFKIWPGIKKVWKYDEKSQKSRLLESQKLLKDIESSIRAKEIDYQKMKSIKQTFQTNQAVKAVKESLKLLETEIASLRERLEVRPVCSSLEAKDLMEGLALLKGNETDLRRIAEILQKLQGLNEKIIEIGSTFDVLKKQWQKNHHSDVKIPQVLMERSNRLNVNQELSLLTAAIDETILSIDRAPFHLLDRADGFSPRSQYIVTALVPGLLEYADSNIIGLRFDDATQSSRVFKVSKKEARQYLDPPL